VITLNPVEPPMIMRNTVFCAISPSAPQEAITASVEAMVAEVARYVPGYTLRAEPQFDPPEQDWSGWARVALFLEVRGNGDYLPPWAGNLDIMTAAAAREAGASVARIATHCTEADVSVQHFGAARDLGMEMVGFLMLAHRLDPAGLARQATFSRLGITTGVDVDEVLAAAEEVVRPITPRLPWMDRSSVVQGYAGVYSSLLLHAQRAAERYGVPAHAILQRVGQAGYVGGQEDMIIDVALQLQEEAARG
jgi:DmpG-like communication domain/Prokaryotic acetaldehyde dehydrogenase, dimerisation